MLKIKVFENAQSFYEKEFPTDAEIKIGRAEHCALVLRSKRISREHCRIFFQNGRWQAEDLNSQNGIRLNGNKIVSEPLTHGDNLLVGDYRLEIVLAPAQDAAAGSAVPDSDDRTVLLEDSSAIDKTIVRPLPFPADAGNGGVVEKFAAPFVKNKRLMAGAVGLLLVLFIIIWISASSKDAPDPEKVLLPAEQEKTEAMIDLESQHRIRVYLQSGQEQFDAGNYTEALVRFQAVLKIDPENETALAYVSQSREKIIEIEEQRRLAANEQQQRMDRVATIITQAQQAFRRSEYDSAMEIIAEAAFLAPGDPSVTALKAEIEAAVKQASIQKEQTLQQKEEALAKIKQHFDSGQQYYDQGKYHEALREWDQVLAMNMETPETAHVRHAVVHIKTLLEKDVRADYEKGKTYFANKDYTRAITYLQKVSQVLPDYQDTRKILADAVTELESQAKRLYQEGLVYEGIGQNEKAAAKWREVLNVMPVETNEYYQRAAEKLQ